MTVTNNHDVRPAARMTSMPISREPFVVISEEAGLLIVYGSSSTSPFEGRWSSCSPASHHPKVQTQLGGRTTSFMFLADRADRRGRPLRFEHLRERSGGETSSEEVGCIEAHDQSSSRPLATSVSKLSLGWKGARGIASSHTPHHGHPPHPCPLPKSTSNGQSSD